MKTGEIVFGSIVTKSHLHMARALRQTVAMHHPTAPHYFLLVDSHSTADLPAACAGEVYLPLQALLTDPIELRHLTFYFDAFELCCALKPLLARYLLDHVDADTVVYLDCDMTLHGPLSGDCLPGGEASIVLTPHWLTAAAADWQAQNLKFGAFNAGYFAVRKDEVGCQFADFWWEHCRRFSAHDLPRGLFVDQLWLNLVPALFPRSFSTCRHLGVNVSWWNLHERELRYEGDRVVTRAGEPLLLFHWSLVEFGTGRLFRNRPVVDPVQGAETLATLTELHHRYEQLLKGGAAPVAAPAGYRYATFNNGLQISSVDRRIHRDRCASGCLSSFDPFAESAWFKAQRRKEGRRAAMDWARRHLRTASLGLTGSTRAVQSGGAVIRRGRAWLGRAHDELRRLEARAKPLAKRTLTDLAAIHGSDKGTLIGQRHGYTCIYDELFAELRARPRLAVLEIGLRHDPYYKKKSRISPSLSMWRDYFPSAEIFGLDINDFSEMAGGRIHIFQGDQGDPRQLAQVLEATDAFDVVIDDGSHASYHQLVTLRTLFPKVRPGGFYIIEDLDWQPPDLEARLPKTPTLARLLRERTFTEDLGVPLHSVEILIDGKLAIIRKPVAPPAS